MTPAPLDGIEPSTTQAKPINYAQTPVRKENRVKPSCAATPSKGQKPQPNSQGKNIYIRAGGYLQAVARVPAPHRSTPGHRNLHTMLTGTSRRVNIFPALCTIQLFKQHGHTRRASEYAQTPAHLVEPRALPGNRTPARSKQGH